MKTAIALFAAAALLAGCKTGAAKYLPDDPAVTEDVAWIKPSPIGTNETPLALQIKARDGTNYLGVYMGMIAENVKQDGSVMMFSATSGELLKWIPRQDFEDIFVKRIKPEYPK